jgi:membrane peptidoglycan carboxypeptidase
MFSLPHIRKVLRLRVIGSALLAAFVLWTAWLYASAPVESLRGVISYTPPHKHYQRQAGLGLPDNLQLKDIPAPVLMMVLAAEDVDFHEHAGVSPKRIYWNIKYYITKSRHWGAFSAASTLTQQLVKNTFTGPEKTLYRKYVELIYALKTERHFTKEEIFTLYINMAQVGPDTYGYQQGARELFGKDFKDLTPIEAVVIVNSMPSPARRTAWLREGKPDKTAFRRISMLLFTTYGLMNNYAGWGAMAPEDKEKAFSHFMLSPTHQVCPYAEWDEVLKIWSRQQTENFLRKHWKGDIKELKGA